MRRLNLLLLALAACLMTNGQSQEVETLPVDPDVRTGKLKNGLIYYIRHNQYPENRADFYFAQKVGSMQEEDSQAGLAHFLEHMAFNGTEHYPGRKTMLNYLETVGAQFGSNVNAYTGFDETVYTLSNIPVTRQQIIDSTLLILRDWSGYIELDNEEIDKERAIIKEEWRTRTGAQSRIWEKQLPVIFRDSKYANRMPIGKMEVVENFDYQQLKDYYKKWYRPDLQAVIIVGDIDADKMEAQVKDLFSKIPMPENPAERIYYPVPDNEEPIISIVTDKEETRSIITYYVKHDVMPKEVQHTKDGYTIKMASMLATSMLGQRLNEISKTAESPFVASTVFDNNFFVSKTKDAWTSIVMSKEGEEKRALASLIREIERAKRFGFTDAELERTKADYLASLEQTYSNRDKHQNNIYVQEYVRSFTDGEPIPGIAFEYELTKKILPTLTADVVNALVLKILTDENNVITMTGPEKDRLVLPTEAEVRDILDAVRNEDIEMYMEEVITEPLLSKLPESGSIVKVEQDSIIEGMEVWTLSNEIKVAVMDTPYKNDEIIMSGIAYGGYSLAPNSAIHEAGLANYVPYIGGIGNFSSTDLNKVLAGKTASVNIGIGETTHGFSGYSSRNDLETLMQLLYLYFTAPRKDEGMFTNIRSMLLSQVKNAKSRPSFALDQYTTFAKYGYNPRYVPMTVEDVMNLDYDLIIDFYKQITSNPSSFDFTFVGSIDKDALKPMVEKYLASLPAGDKAATYNKDAISEIRSGKSKVVFEQSMIEPKTTFYTLYNAKFDYTQKNRFVLDMLSQVLDIVYTKTIREDEGGTYGVRQSIGIGRVPEGQATLTILFDTDADKVKKLAPMIHAELEKIAADGPADEDFNKVKEHSLKAMAENKTLNAYWKQIVEMKLFYGEDNLTEAVNVMNAVTKEDIKQAANQFISQDNLIEVIMNPKEIKEE